MIFNPVDMMGPAHKANQTLQQLAQNAAQNVLRRQKMKALLSGAGRGAAAGGAGISAGQPFRGSTMMRPGGAKSSVLMRMLGGPGASGGVSGGHGNDGVFGNAGGGYDYPSLPAPADHAQSAESTVPGPTNAVPSPAAPMALNQAGGDPLANGGNFRTVDASQGAGSTDNFSPIHLGNGLYYDPLTDTVSHGTAQGVITGNVRTGGSTL